MVRTRQQQTEQDMSPQEVINEMIENPLSRTDQDRSHAQRNDVTRQEQIGSLAGVVTDLGNRLEGNAIDDQNEDSNTRVSLRDDPARWYDARNLRLETLTELDYTKVRNFLHKYDILKRRIGGGMDLRGYISDEIDAEAQLQGYEGDIERFLRKYIEVQRENRAANITERLKHELKWSTENRTAEEKVDILFRRAQEIIMGPLPVNI